MIPGGKCLCADGKCPPVTSPVLPVARIRAEKELVSGLLAALDRPGAVIEQVVVGSRFIGVLAQGQVGLASTLGASSPGPAHKNLADQLPGRTLGQAAELLLSEEQLLRSLGLAALNAGFNQQKLEAGPNAAEVLFELGKDRKVVVVGDFPFTSMLSREAESCHLLELRGGPQITPLEEWETVLEACDLAVITSTSLLTRCLAYFLTTAKRAHKVLLGPSTPLTGFLLDHGADALAGSRVQKTVSVMQGIMQDLSFRELKQAGIEFVYLTRA